MAETGNDLGIDMNEIENLVELSAAVSEALGMDFGDIPEIIADCPLDSFAYERTTKGYEFECVIFFVFEEDDAGEPTEELKITVYIAVEGNKKEYSGSIEIPINDDENTLTFEALFKEDKDKNSYAIAKADFSDTSIVALPGVINEISPSLGAFIPEELAFDAALNALLVVSQRGKTSKKKYILGFSSNSEIDMELVPLLKGQFLPKFTPIDINLQFLAALDKFTASEVKAINNLLEEADYPVLIKKEKQRRGSTSQDLLKGASISAHFEVGRSFNETLFLYLIGSPSSSSSGGGSSSSKTDGGKNTSIKPPGGKSNIALGSQTTSQPSSQKKNSRITRADNAIWLKMEKSFGPVYFKKLGLQYSIRDGKSYIECIPEIGLVFRNFSLIFNEVSVRSPLANFDPSFHLDGFELQYECGIVKIAGGFLHTEYDDYDEYAGMGLLKLNLGRQSSLNMDISAIAAYADMHDHGNAFFLYAVLDYPIGGPLFLFCTGLSAGFGYNYDLNVPSIEDIGKFPLVSEAVSGGYNWRTDNITKTIQEELDKLLGPKYVEPTDGAGFLALGIKFTSYGLIDSFGLVTLAIDNAFELNLIGNASLIVPGATKRMHLIHMEMYMKTTFSTKTGVFSMEAQLAKGSYIFSKSCKLTGGYAVYIWFAGEHDGDFVVSLGGYHDYFQAPAHYPIVPRVGCDWKLGPMHTTGQIYVALCAHAAMAGGFWECEFRLGPAYASFRVGADFLIAWKPYYYDVHFEIKVKAGFGFLGPIKVGVDLRMWGPDFGGFAEIDVFLFSFDIEWGDQSESHPSAIYWQEFQESFLPHNDAGEEEPDQVCNIAFDEGLVKEIKETEDSEGICIVNPRKFEIVADTLIPVHEAFLGDSAEATDTGVNTTFGIKPMAVSLDQLTSGYRVKITLQGNDGEKKDVSNELFAFEPLTKRFPTSVWGESSQYESQHRVVYPPAVNEPLFVENTLSGFRIVPAVEPEVGNTEDIEVALLLYDVDLVSPAYAWNNIVPFTGSSTEEGRATIKETVVSNDERDSLLTALGFELTDVKVDDSMADDFVIAPLVQ